MKTFITTLFIISCLALSAQQTGSLTVYGIMKYKKSIVNEVQIEVYRDNKVYKELLNVKNGSFKLYLQLGHVYSVTFRKESFIEKSIAVVAKTDSSISINGRYFFQLDIELFKEEDHEVDESMLPPVAKLYIKDQDSGFTFDKKYVKWVAEKFDEEFKE
ncbi:MAG: putative membrane protein YfhO [Vicingaceae bacterium]|jgi:uncharacterized membrane protein YfhO